MGCPGLPWQSGTFFLNCDEQSVSSPQTELVEVGPRNNEFQTVSLVDHLDL
jgi:hypothetical protein